VLELGACAGLLLWLTC